MGWRRPGWLRRGRRGGQDGGDDLGIEEFFHRAAS